MRLAVLADIHGNADALEAVRADLARQSPDLVVNLGDCLSGPLEVERTAEPASPAATTGPTGALCSRPAGCPLRRDRARCR